MVQERIARAHDFWKLTCGIDTRWRNSARSDTPWNAFTEDGSRLVNTVWADRIVTVQDQLEGRARRFVRLGLLLASWTPQRLSRARPARSKLEEAHAQHKRVYGFEAEPEPTKLEKGDRAIKHFYLDRVHLLKPHRGLDVDQLVARLDLDKAFKAVIPEDEGFAIQPAILFELLPADVDAPGGAPDVDVDVDEGLEEADLEAGPPSELMAESALRELVSHVLQQRDDVLVPITYKDLAARIGRTNRHGEPWARGLGVVLSRVTEMVDLATAGWADRPPYLSCIVVLSAGVDQGLPAAGVRERWPGYERLSRNEKADRVAIEFSRILAFGVRWISVLDELGLRLGDPAQDVAEGGEEGGSPGNRSWGAGGESQAHRNLKQFVVDHPELFGATPAFDAQLEFGMRSGDAIDVLMRSSELWVGVEVKSRVSDSQPHDYLRGIFQVIKYRAVLEAQARVDHPEQAPKIIVLLALETQLPANLHAQADLLGVQVVDDLQRHNFDDYDR